VGFSATGLSLSSYWYNQAKDLESLVGQWFADWTPNFSTELKVSKRDYASRPHPSTATRLPQVGLRFSGALPADAPGVSANNRFLNLGTERSRHFNVLETETLDIYAGATWNAGCARAEVRPGLCRQRQSSTPSCRTPTATTPSPANPAPTLRHLRQLQRHDAAQRELATLENFRKGNPSASTVQAPLPARRSHDARASGVHTATRVLFVQDSWKLSKRFSLMLRPAGRSAERAHHRFQCQRRRSARWPAVVGRRNTRATAVASAWTTP
jgi:hypothetical protein